VTAWASQGVSIRVIADEPRDKKIGKGMQGKGTILNRKVLHYRRTREKFRKEEKSKGTASITALSGGKLDPKRGKIQGRQVEKGLINNKKNTSAGPERGKCSNETGPPRPAGGRDHSLGLPGQRSLLVRTEPLQYSKGRPDAKEASLSRN